MSREKSAHHAEVRWIEMSEGIRAGMVCRERKEEQPRDLLRDGVLSEKRRGTPSGRHLDFLAHGRRSDGYMGSLKNERLLIQVRRGSERSSTNDSPIEPEFPDTLEILKSTCSLPAVSYVS